MIILASGSPRRAELLRAAGIEFTIRAADVDESIVPGESPADYVKRLSVTKASSVAQPGEVVLGADTTVVIDNEIAGKPIDTGDAKRMLKAMSGRWHEVLTGVTLIGGGGSLTEIESTRVEFAPMSDEEIDWYISTGEPMDKAGAYGIQGYASRFIKGIEGNYSNVVGLPVEMIYRMIRSLNTLK